MRVWAANMEAKSECRQQAHAEHTEGYNRPHHERHSKGQSAEYQTFAQILAQIEKIYFKTCEKHEVEDAHLAENLEAHVASQPVEAVGPITTPATISPMMGNLEPVEEERHKKYHPSTIRKMGTGATTRGLVA